MAIPKEIEQAMFKNNLVGHPYVTNCAENRPELTARAFELMNTDRCKPAETKAAQFKRIYEIIYKNETRARNSQEQLSQTQAWKQAYKAQYKGAITPERIKEMLDEQLDRGEINDVAYENGMKGLELMFGYIILDMGPGVSAEPEAGNSLPF